MKRAAAIAAVVLSLLIVAGPAQATGGASGCCRTITVVTK